MRQDGYTLQFASQQLRGDREVVLHGRIEAASSEQLCGDREVLLAAISNYGWALGLASQQLRGGHRELMLAAMKQNGKALLYAPQQLKNDREKTVVVGSIYACIAMMCQACDAVHA